MTYIGYDIKDPSSTLGYAVDWTWWLPLGGKVEASSFTVTGPDTALQIIGVLVDPARQVTYVFLSGGTLGAKYEVTNSITSTQSGFIISDRRTFLLSVEKR